jgi:hypothetical protein
MSFLAPLFLLGALAVAAPIVFHLIRRTSREKIPFSSLMFLRPTPPRMTRRSRLEHWLLLVLRCLVLGLLALGFARPFLQKPTAADPGAGAGRRWVVMVDTSASLRRDGLWAEAKARAARVLRETRPEDSVALVAFDRASRTLVSFEDWDRLPAGERAALAAARLDGVTPGWAGTHLGRALLNAAQLLEEQPGRAGPGAFAARKIVVISDGQEGAHLDGLQGFDWPRGVEVVLETLAAKHPTNAGLQLLSDGGGEAGAEGEAVVRVRVSNAATSRREQFQLGWRQPGSREEAGAPVDVYVPAGQSRVVAAPRAPAGLATGALVLRGDEEEFDNTAHVAVPAPVEVPVLYLGRDDVADPGQLLFYVNRALQQTRRQAARVTARPATGPLPPAGAADAVLWVLGESPSPEVARAVRERLASGRTGLLVLRDAGMGPALATLLGVGTVTMAEAGGRHALLGQIDFTHPLFAPFADPRYSDFTKIHFWKHRRLDTNGLPGARVVAGFDDGSPALVQFPVGRGSLLVLTAGWHPADSQLALSTKFVPLLYSLLELAGAASAAPAVVTVGDPVPLGPTNEAARMVVRRPDGVEVRPGAVAALADTALPGVYTLVSATATQRFAVNLDAAESRTGPWQTETLERLGVPLKPPAPVVKASPEQERRLRDTELEQQQKLWRWLLVVVLGLLVAETWMAGWLSRRPAPAA